MKNWSGFKVEDYYSGENEEGEVWIECSDCTAWAWGTDYEDITHYPTCPKYELKGG